MFLAVMCTYGYDMERQGKYHTLYHKVSLTIHEVLRKKPHKSKTDTYHKNHSVCSHSVLYCCARGTRFEFWAVALAVEAAAVILRSNRVNLLHRLSFSFVDLIVDLIVDLLAPMEELLCGT